MSTTYTANLDLQKPGVADRIWNVQLSANIDILDGLAPIGDLAVTPREYPSTSLYLNVSAGGYRKADGTPGLFSGSVGVVAVPNNATSVAYLDGSGNLVVGSGYPTTSHVRLATIAAAGGAITSISDDRITCSVIGTDSIPFLPLAGGTLAEGANLVLGTATGTKLGTATSQKLGFWGSTPIVRPTSYTQTYSTATKTVGAYSSNVQTTAFTGIATGVGGTPYAQLTDLNNLRLAYENLRLFAENVAQVLNALIDDLQSMGIVG